MENQQAMARMKLKKIQELIEEADQRKVRVSLNPVRLREALDEEYLDRQMFLALLADHCPPELNIKQHMDLYRDAAMTMLDKKKDEVTEEERRMVKSLIIASLYGCENTNISVSLPNLDDLDMRVIDVRETTPSSWFDATVSNVRRWLFRLLCEHSWESAGRFVVCPKCNVVRNKHDLH